MRIILLCLLFIVGGVNAADYSRSAFGGWVDADDNCLNSRMETLKSDSLVKPRIVGCKVVSGLWVDPYTAVVITSPGDADIDHIIPLKEAWLSGANKWSRAKRVQFANDPENLISVTVAANRSKGSSDPAGWMPPNSAYWPEYLARWTHLKRKYGLSVDALEAEAINFHTKQETGKSAPLCSLPNY